MLIHEIAESIGLFHYSEGVDAKRHIIVAKEQKIIKVLQEDDTSSGEDTNDEKTEAKTKPSTTDASTCSKQKQTKPIDKILAPPSEAATKHCTLCGRNVPTPNFTIHRLACEKRENESIALQQEKRQQQKQIEATEQELAQKSKNKKKKTKKQKASSNVAAANDEDDFDAVVSSFSARNKRCNLRGCKDTNSLLLQACRWCHSAYCLAHFIAEAHGCGKHAKEQARATVVREGVIYPGSGVPSKLPNADKRAQLHRQLDKKLSAMESDRKKQNKKK
uniref:DNA-binding protein SMUBP-2-like n=2 Tax=Hirondellea gigas TaxID=1518452 RepID=A0A2P2I3Q5_9CRUS